MNAIQNSIHKRAPRIDAALQVRFSINGGPDHISNTLNFTSRSVAIRSECPANKGDHVAVRFGGLPAIEGEVVRVFPEGFAVVLDEASLSMMKEEHASDNKAHKFDIGDADTLNNIASPLMRTRAPFQARARISTVFSNCHGANRHILSIITADPQNLAKFNNVWISAAESRWPARSLRVQRRGNRGVALMALNDWQLHMAAAYGLSVSIISGQMDEWTIEIDADPIADHLDSLVPQKMAVNA